MGNAEFTQEDTNLQLKKYHLLYMYHNVTTSLPLKHMEIVIVRLSVVQTVRKDEIHFLCLSSCGPGLSMI